MAYIVLFYGTLSCKVCSLERNSFFRMPLQHKCKMRKQCSFAVANYNNIYDYCFIVGMLMDYGFPTLYIIQTLCYLVGTGKMIMSTIFMSAYKRLVFLFPY